MNSIRQVLTVRELVTVDGGINRNTSKGSKLGPEELTQLEGEGPSVSQTLTPALRNHRGGLTDKGPIHHSDWETNHHIISPQPWELCCP